jgi:hypothetical protein
MKSFLTKTAAVSLLLIYLDRAYAVEFEKMGTAVAGALKVTKASKASTTVDGKPVNAFYAKDGAGKPSRFAVVQQRIYPPNCTHTWVIGLDASAKVDDIHVVEMGCTHAYPTKEKSFLQQFYGKSLADVKSLKGNVQTVAKATGTSELTADAVITAITAVGQLKKTL